MKANKKVKNATVTVVDGIKFRSKLEAYMYGLLKQYGIKFQYETEKFPLIEKFVFRGEKVREAVYTPDFTSVEGAPHQFIIECKGRPNDAWPLRLKLFKQHCVKANEQRPYYIPTNKKDCDAVIAEILKQNSAK